MIRRIFLISIGIIPLFVYAVSIDRFADTPNRLDFVVQPAKVEVSLYPGEKRMRNIYITNRLGERASFNVSIESFAASRDPRGGVILGESPAPSFVAVSDRTFVLSQGERAEVPVTIAVPRGTDPGGQFFAVVVSGSSEHKISGAAHITSRVAALFFVRIEGVMHEAGILNDFSYRDGFFEILFENTGTVHINPYGVITIHRWWRGDATIFVDPWFVLPGSSRIRAVALPINLGWGRYTATLLMNRGYHNVVDTKEIVFWILPKGLELVVGVVGILLATIFIVAMIKRIKRYATKH